MITTFHYTLQQDNITIEQLLRDNFQIGKKIMHEMRMAKSIVNENGEPVVWQHHYPVDTKLTFHVNVEPSSYVATKNSEVPILFEDAHVLVVSKPADMLTHPNEPGQTGTCMNHVMAYVNKQGGVYAEHVHRLDQGTKGLVLIAKHPLIKSMLDRMLEEKKIIRTYEAIVDGYMTQKSGSIRTSIGTDRHDSARRAVSPSGQTAITHFEVVGQDSNFTKVNVILETGRTHQIRVHFSSIGHPITGDRMYGSRTRADNYSLQAKKLQFVHPITKEMIVVEDYK
ncbi:RluA family pseudouridine synthase [Paenisporosarcina antarctica]|uniref:Pseudouridine synthase n=1 Tax=Paenisporosarcina antarctica TaxID=417367 RepID=A0A4P6ZVX5_9BACL|nr:RluA family pseudouridine synthase [Paenisporosarcina antarctica]QBP40393.1 RluA family pseudouridine synthase [Paenisporosarcina antarctica]